MTNEIKPCWNCGHANEHTSPSGAIADMCDEPECICCYYAPAEVPAAREEIRTTRIKVLEECLEITRIKNQYGTNVGNRTWRGIEIVIQALIDKERASNGRD